MEHKEFRDSPRLLSRAARQAARRLIATLDATTRPFAEQMVEDRKNALESAVFSDTDIMSSSHSSAKGSLDLRNTLIKGDGGTEAPIVEQSPEDGAID